MCKISKFTLDYQMILFNNLQIMSAFDTPDISAVFHICSTEDGTILTFLTTLAPDTSRGFTLTNLPRQILVQSMLYTYGNNFVLIEK